MSNRFISETVPSPLRVFLSSTFYDLKSVRQDLVEFLRASGFEPIVFETAGALPNIPAADSALQHAAQADICILIVGTRYGAKSEEMGLSYTHQEFRTAMDRGRPIFSFIEQETLIKFEMYRARPASDFWTEDEKMLFSFIGEVSELGSRFPFTTLPELQKGLRHQLSSYFGYLVRKYAILDTLAPVTASGWITIGNNLWDKRGEIGGAIYCYRRALELDGEWRYALENLTRAQRVTGRYTEALPLCEKAIQLYPHLAVYGEERARILFDMGKQTEAIQQAKKNVEDFPNDDATWVTLCHLHWRTGAKREAALAAKKAYELRPENRTAYRLFQDYRSFLADDLENGSQQAAGGG